MSDELAHLAGAARDWVAFAGAATEVLGRRIGFDRCCWHSVDPGTVMLTGSLNRGVGCSGTWLAEHEYVVDDVNKWSFLARSGRLAGATSIATHGDLTRSPRHRSQEGFGIGDELRGSLVLDGVYWGAVALLRDAGRPFFDQREVDLLASICPLLAAGFRQAAVAAPAETLTTADDVPGVIVFAAGGAIESISPAAVSWVTQLPDAPADGDVAASRPVELVAARARVLADGRDPLGAAARVRVRTRSGRWLLMYGTPLAGGTPGRTAVIIQPAPRSEIVPIIGLAYSLTAREREVSELCLRGLPTKAMAGVLGVSRYTVQDHLKAIFAKTGAASRGDLVGRIFLDHYVPRWEPIGAAPDGCTAWGIGGPPAVAPE